MEGHMENIKGRAFTVPLVDYTLTKEGYAADAKTTGEALKARVKKTDVVDNLSSDAADKPLSANQGKVIKEQLDKINLSQAGTVAYNNAESGLEATNMQSGLDEVARIAKNSVSKNGDTIRGALKVQNEENGYGAVEKNNALNEDFGTQIIDATKEGTTASINVCAKKNEVTFTGADGLKRQMHHELTKPFGSYEGIGNVRPRMVDTNGIGNLAMIWCDDYFSMATPKGVIVVNKSGSIQWMDGERARFENGVLYMETADESLNSGDVVYYYQVI